MAEATTVLPQAATTVVTTLNEASVQAAITRGGKIFVKGSGTLTVATGWTFPTSKEVDIDFDSRITVDIGNNAISLFTFPNGPASVLWHKIRNIKAVGGNVANQWFMTFSDAGSYTNVSVYNRNVTGFRNYTNHTAGDTVFDRAAIVHEYGGQICPPGVGTGYILKTNHTASNAPAFAVSTYMDGVRVFTPGAGNQGFLMDYGGDLYLSGEEFSLSGASKVCGLTLRDSAVIIGVAATGADTLEVFQRSWDCTTMGMGFLIGITMKLSQGSGNPAIIDSMVLGYGSRIQVNCDRACLNNIVQRESNPGNPDYVIDVLAGADDCEIQGGMADTASVALIRTSALRTRVSDFRFNATGIPTLLEAGAADFGRYGNCIGLGTGTGYTLVGTSSRVDGVQAGKADGAGTVAFGWGRLTTSYGDIGNVGGGTDDLHSFTIPANVLNVTGRTIRVKAWGRTANNANAKTLAMLFGGTTIMTQALTTGIAGTWRIDAEIVKNGNNTQRIFAELLQLATIIHKQTATAGAITDTAGIIVKCTAAATADNDIVQEGMIIEVS